MSDASTEYEESLLDSSDDDDVDWLAEQIYRVDDETLDRESRAEAFLANLKKEVSKKHLQGELRRKFDEADLSEWRSIVEKDVVRLLTEIEAARVYKIEPERVMGSRFVRTRKELDIGEINVLPEGSISWKAHQDGWCKAILTQMPMVCKVLLLCLPLDLCILFCKRQLPRRRSLQTSKLLI